MTDDPLLEAVLKTGVTLPTPGVAFARLQALSVSESAGPRDMADVVGKDPSAIGALMRVANSPVFGLRARLRSVQDAITVLGRTRTLAVCMSTALHSHMEGVDELALEMVWNNSLRAAEEAWRCARASRRGRNLADQVYLAGLLQDVGIAVLLKRYPGESHLFRHGVMSLEEASGRLDANTAADHAAVSALVARNWRLPTEISEAIRCHHHPTAAQRLPDEAATLATLMAFGRLLRDGPSEDWLAWAPLADRYLELDPAGLGD